MSAARMPRESAEPLDVKIALMHRRDVRHVMPIERRVYPRGWSKGVFIREIAQRTTRCYLTAKVGSTLVGYTGMLLAPDEAHITNIAVAPEWQRHKLATRMLLTQAGWQCVARRRRALTLEVRPSNHGAQELYRRFGFAPAGMRKLYYPRSGRGRPRHVGARHRRACVPLAAASDRDRDPRHHRRGRRGLEVTGRGSDGDGRREHLHPRHRDVVRRDGGGRASMGGARRAVVGGVEPGRPARPVRRRRARDRQPGPRRAAHPGDRPGARRGRRRRRPASTRSPPPSARARRVRCSSACRAAKALALVWDVPFVGVNHLEAHLYAALLEEPAARAAARRAARVGRPHDARRDGGPRALPAARPDHRRRRRRGVRQGRPLPRPRLPGRARRSTAIAMQRRPDGDRASRGRCSTTGSTSRSRGLKTVGRQPRPQAPRRSTPPTSPRRSRQAVVDVLVDQGAPGRRRGRGARASCLGGGVAANSLLREQFLDACDEDGLPGVPAEPRRCAPTTRR